MNYQKAYKAAKELIEHVRVAQFTFPIELERIKYWELMDELSVIEAESEEEECKHVINANGESDNCFKCGRQVTKTIKEIETFEPKSIFTRRQIRHNKTYDFVVKHKALIYQCARHFGNFNAGKTDCQLQELIALARKEIGYSYRTWSGDIFTTLVNLYRKICA